MADLSTLNGISAARTELYNKLEKGDMPEQRANIMERVLRGQTVLHGDLRLKFMSLMARYKNGKLEAYIAGTAAELSEFIEGKPKALPE